MIRFHPREITRPLKVLIDIDFHRSQCQKFFIAQILMPLIMSVVRDSHNLISLFQIGCLDLLRRQMSVGMNCVTVEVRFVNIPFFGQ